MESFAKKMSELGLEGSEKLLLDRNIVNGGNTHRSFLRFANWFVKTISPQTVLADAELQEYDKLRKLEVTMRDSELLRSEVEKARTELQRKQQANSKKREENDRLKAQLVALRREKECTEVVLEMLKQENERQFVAIAELNSSEQTAHQRVRANEEEAFGRNEKLNEVLKQLESVITELLAVYQVEFQDVAAESSANRQFLAAQNLDVLFDETNANVRAVADYVHDAFYTDKSDHCSPVGLTIGRRAAKKEVEEGGSECEGEDDEETSRIIQRVSEWSAELRRLKRATERSYDAYLRTRRREVALQAQRALATERLNKLTGSTDLLNVSMDEVTLEIRKEETVSDCVSLRLRIAELESHMHMLVQEFAEASVVEPVRLDYEAKRRAQRHALTAHRFVFERLLRVRCVLECVLFLMERERSFQRDVAKILSDALTYISRLDARHAARFAALAELNNNTSIPTEQEAGVASEKVESDCAIATQDNGLAEDVQHALKRLETLLFADETDFTWRLKVAGESQLQKLNKMTKSLERCVCELVGQFDERRGDERVRKSRALFAHFATRNEPALRALCASHIPVKSGES